MTEQHRVEINLGVNEATVLINGQHFENKIKGLMLRADANGARRLILDLELLDAEIDGQAVVTVPGKTRDALLALGWIPPLEATENETNKGENHG